MTCLIFTWILKIVRESQDGHILYLMGTPCPIPKRVRFCNAHPCCDQWTDGRTSVEQKKKNGDHCHFQQRQRQLESTPAPLVVPSRNCRCRMYVLMVGSYSYSC